MPKRSFIIFSLALMGLSPSSYSQEDLFYYQEVKTWDIGPRLGFTTSIINSKGNNSFERDVIMGLVGGVFARYQIADQWAIQGDLSYSSRGSKRKSSDAKLRNNYIDFSTVMVRNVKYRMFKNDLTFDFFLGPGISYLIRSELQENGEKLGFEDQMASTELNIVVGGGLPMGPLLLMAYTRFGVVNLLDNPVDNTMIWHSISTEWTASYRF
jgi:Outer membrane protein beta-barrel domain